MQNKQKWCLQILEIVNKHNTLMCMYSKGNEANDNRCLVLLTTKGELDLLICQVDFTDLFMPLNINNPSVIYLVLSASCYNN